jgi:hypothetical protein
MNAIPLGRCAWPWHAGVIERALLARSIQVVVSVAGPTSLR